MNRFLKLSLFLAVLVAGCAGARYIPLEAEVGKLDSHPPFPVKAALWIPPETGGYLYHSPKYIPSRPLPNFDSLRPFVLPVGEALTKAASLTFSQLFQEISVVEDFPSVDSFPLVVEIKLERFDLRLQYAVFGYRRFDHLLDVEGKVRVGVRLAQPGKSAWGKNYEIVIPPDRHDLNPWTAEAVGRQVASSLGLLFQNIAADLTAEMDKPLEPLRQLLPK